MWYSSNYCLALILYNIPLLLPLLISSHLISSVLFCSSTGPQAIRLSENVFFFLFLFLPSKLLSPRYVHASMQCNAVVPYPPTK
ncbi:hypothetical protein F4815DRAFT_226627 [Daldinia loculata]|nr:hypothetical protein F4815DRAFT_226627 [Daldinia loculata]